ncbi:MAG: glycosyltransferase [Balneolaceae bacterium]
MNEQKKLFIIGSVWPEPNSSAAGSRMIQIIEQFQQNGWSITFGSIAGDSNFSVDLKEMGIQKVSLKLNDESFDSFVKELNPAIVLFDRFMTEEQFGWRVAEQCSDAIRILDTEDLHCLREGRRKAWIDSREFSQDDLMTDIARREIASIFRCDLSLIISKYEMKLLTDFFNVDESLLLYLPFMLDPIDESMIKKWPDFNSRKHFISIGNFLHQPNWNAVFYLKEEIWPKIRAKLPEAELHIYGAYSSTKVEQLHKPEKGFMVKGRAEDAKAVMKNARILLAPLRFGAGLKGKLIEAMQCGTPTVTTSVGAEAMHGEYDWSGFVEDRSDDFVESAIKLYTIENVWTEAQSKGETIINNLYSKSEFGEAFLERVSKLWSNIEEHRKKNFIGSMLMHHSMASTKFMSRWIEEKNK